MLIIQRLLQSFCRQVTWLVKVGFLDLKHPTFPSLFVAGNVRFCCVSPSFWVIYRFLEECDLQIAINLRTVIFTIHTSRIRSKIFTFRNFTQRKGDAIRVPRICKHRSLFMMVHHCVGMNIVCSIMVNNRLGFCHYGKKLLFVLQSWQDYG